MSKRQLSLYANLNKARVLLTLAPTIYDLDSAELTTAAATGGIVRAAGHYDATGMFRPVNLQTPSGL